MKIFIGLIILCLGLQASADGQIVDSEIVISDITTELEIALNEKTVLCLIGDYGANFFKIAIPQIKNLTFLDHTSPGAPGPCITAGMCKTSASDDLFGATQDYRFPSFHDPLKPTELVSIRVIKKEVSRMYIDKRFGNSCEREYVEEISSDIRGVHFFHRASLPLATLPIEKCQ